MGPRGVVGRLFIVYYTIFECDKLHVQYVQLRTVYINERPEIMSPLRRMKGVLSKRYRVVKFFKSINSLCYVGVQKCQG